MINLQDLRAAWCEETASPGSGGSDGAPHGQCAVTALLVLEILGGEILRAEFDDGTSHYWNLIEEVGEIDLTRSQYPECMSIPRGSRVPWHRVTDGDRARAAKTQERYDLLRERYREAGGSL